VERVQDHRRRALLDDVSRRASFMSNLGEPVPRLPDTGSQPRVTTHIRDDGALAVADGLVEERAVRTN